MGGDMIVYSTHKGPQVRQWRRCIAAVAGEQVSAIGAQLGKREWQCYRLRVMGEYYTQHDKMVAAGVDVPTGTEVDGKGLSTEARLARHAK